MKRLVFFLCCALAAANAAAQSTVSLDDAIKTSATDIEAKLTKGVKVVVLNFKAPTKRFSDYVLEELTAAIVNSGKLLVVDRQNLALIQQEMDFQMSGEVSDTSAQEIGMKLGAQSIVSGSLEDMGDYYRIRFRTIEVCQYPGKISPLKGSNSGGQTSPPTRRRLGDGLTVRQIKSE
jgi:TolB-like protein